VESKKERRREGVAEENREQVECNSSIILKLKD